MDYGDGIADWMAPFAQRVDEILFYDWDPMRVSNWTQDGSYKKFVGQLTILALNQTKAADLAEALWRIEELYLKIETDQLPTVQVADKIRAEADQYLRALRKSRKNKP